MKKFILAFLTLTMIFGISATAFAKTDYDIDSVMDDTSSYIHNTVRDPQVGSIGGEWAVLGLARSGADIPNEYYENYYKNVEEYVKKRSGILHEKKFTEYSRVIVALTSIGKNPADVAGYNLLTPLGDYEKTVWQGINGAVWALIALDSGNYDMPKNPDANVQATREMYINHILEKQTADGGWSLLGDRADPDITGMALQALSKYRDNEKVKSAIDIALKSMSAAQDSKGGFSSFGTPNSESCVQMLVALCELGIPVDDERFVKNGYTILDNLMNYYNAGNGFTHDKEGTSSNLMATEQSFYGLVAVKRAKEGKNGLYTMSDFLSIADNSTGVFGLKNKNPDIQKMEVINPGMTFTDIVGHKDKTAVEALASRGIINGKSEDSFEPDSTMTRAEFATIITRGLGLPQKSNGIFSDVSGSDWFYTFVNTAYSYGIVNGVSEKEFNPNGTITREEAAVMVARAAKLCGMETEMDSTETRDVLAQFTDYVRASTWAQGSLAFCYNEGIMDSSVMDIEPKEAATRAEIASMLYNMLSASELL